MTEFNIFQNINNRSILCAIMLRRSTWNRSCYWEFSQAYTGKVERKKETESHEWRDEYWSVSLHWIMMNNSVPK